jgi:hypothetical protein
VSHNSSRVVAPVLVEREQPRRDCCLPWRLLQNRPKLRRINWSWDATMRGRRGTFNCWDGDLMRGRSTWIPPTTCRAGGFGGFVQQPPREAELPLPAIRPRCDTTAVAVGAPACGAVVSSAMRALPGRAARPPDRQRHRWSGQGRRSAGPRSAPIPRSPYAAGGPAAPSRCSSSGGRWPASICCARRASPNSSGSRVSTPSSACRSSD